MNGYPLVSCLLPAEYCPEVLCLLKEMEYTCACIGSTSWSLCYKKKGGQFVRLLVPYTGTQCGRMGRVMDSEDLGSTSKRCRRNALGLGWNW